MFLYYSVIAVISLYVIAGILWVIERYQNENGSGGRSSGIHSASASPTPSERSSPRSLHSRNLRDITPPLREEEDVSDWAEGEATDETVDATRRIPFPEFDENIAHNADIEERDFDEVSGSELQAVDGTWEENWLFQKKKIKTIQSVPVPMLVPNSNTEYRALIGDRDADDTTDLSDNASDAEEELEYKSDIKRILDSKHVIGGKQKLDDDFEPDSLTIIENDFEKLVEDEYKDNEKVVDKIINEINDNNVSVVESVRLEPTDEIDGTQSILRLGIDSGPLTKTEFALTEEIHRTGNGHMNFVKETPITNGSVSNGNLESITSIKGSTNTLSHHEREGEYEETVTVPVQRYADSLRRKHFEDVQEFPTRDTDHDDELMPGTVAYRERKKWENCVEMPNNPYSPEAIQKRLSSKSTSSLFDMITTKSINIDDGKESRRETRGRDSISESSEREHNKLSLTLSNDSIEVNTSKSPSPRALKDTIPQDISQYKRYGRDYYIREAKASSGCRTRSAYSDSSSLSSMHINKATSLDNIQGEFASPGSLIKQFNMIATNQQYNNFAKNNDFSLTTKPNKNELLIEYDVETDKNLFSAEPALINDDADKYIKEILTLAYKEASDDSTNRKNVTLIQITSETNETSNNETTGDSEPLKSPISVDTSYLSSSSLEDTIKIYNVQTGEIVKCKPDNVSDKCDDGSDNIDTDNEILEGNAINVSQNSVVVEETDGSPEINELHDILQQLPKVKELAKKFVSMENLSEIKPTQSYSRRRKSKENLFNDTKSEKQPNKQIYMHSLTARSISREFREELKLSMATPLTVPGGSKEIPEGTEEVANETVRPSSPVPVPGTIKSKLAFFESLKSKFSNNK